METENIRYIPPEGLIVNASTNPFGFGNTVYHYECGLTLAEILAQSCPDLLKYNPIVFINDHKINQEYYHVVKPKPGNIISIKLMPMGGGGGGGGKNPLRTVLSVAVLFAAPYVSGALLGGVLFSSAATGLAVGGLVTAAVSAVGNLAINALVPIAPPAQNSGRGFSSGGSIAEESQTYFIQGARNRLTPFGTVPELFGTHRFTPPLATQNYTEVSGNIIYARQMFCLTNGKVSISNEKLGDTLLTKYQGVSQENFFNGNSTDKSNLIPNIVTQSDLNVELPRNGAFQTRTTAANADEIEVQLTFPEGLGRVDQYGDKYPQDATFVIEYAPTGTSSWVSATYTEVRNVFSSFTIAKRFSVSRNQYDVRIRNTTSGLVYQFPEASLDLNTLFNNITWTALRSYSHENPVNIDGVSLKAIRIQGTKQLNGAIDDYNAVGSRLIENWNGSSWVADQATSNPASIFRHILKSDKAKTPLTDSEIDTAAIQAWHSFCQTKGLEANGYIDYDADREQLLQQVAAAGLASPTIVDNKYSVVVDREKTNIIQHISQRNSFDYSYEKIFRTQVHAFRVSLLNEDKDYLSDEIIVYDDGYNSSNATVFEQIDFPLVTSTDNCYKLARHRLAELRLRPDMHKVNMDIGNLIATRGDRVKFSHDVALIGLKTGRVISVQTSGSNITGVTVDETISMESGKSYSFEFWLSTGESLTVAATTVAGDSNVISFATSIPISGGLDADDLFSFGETDSVTIDAIIHSITPQSDFIAEVKLVDYAPGIFTASQGTIPEYNNNITIPPEFTQPQAPVFVAINSDESAQVRNIDGSVSSRMIISLRNVNSNNVEPIIFIKNVEDTDYLPANTVQRDAETITLEGLTQGEYYDIQIYYRRIGGAELSSNSISLPLTLNGIEFIGEGNPPPDVENFNIIVRGESVRLTWDSVNVIDLDHYELRFTPDTSGAQWQNGLPIDENIPANSTSTVVPSAIGSYMIKAVDRQGNYSINEAIAVTTVGKLLSLNVVETINESSAWGGTFEGTVNDGGSLKLGGSDTIDDWTLIDDIGFWDYGEGSIASGGIYYFANTLDLTEVYDNVISVNIQISGENVFDQIDQWEGIDERDDWDGVTPDQYSVSLQVRTTNDDPNATPVWSSWAPLRPLGEYTARAFEFRLVLTSLASDITPVVSTCIITVDMPDRLEDQKNISSGTGGKSVLFLEAFRVAPTVEITANDLNSGDYIDGPKNITASGFDIEFFDSLNNSVNRTFSYVAKGYGRVS